MSVRLHTPKFSEFLEDDEAVVDIFAGGGGASCGIEAALNRPIDVALNHNAVAMAVHEANHPKTLHLTKNVWRAKPTDVMQGRRVGLLWASPDCTHHSNAKGGKPLNKKLRVLACSVTRWVRDVRPRIVLLENVPEFEKWGPLGADGKPDKKRRGKSFRSWISKFRKYGYAIEWRVLDASLYGAPTRRKRLFVIARCDGQPISWPETTHGPGRAPLHTAAECIDWSLPCPSIFERKTPLKPKTLWRIAQGLRRFVFDASDPFIVRYNGGPGFRGQGLDSPLTTADTSNRFGIVDPFLVKVNHGKHEARGESLAAPLSTITAQRRGHALAIPILQQSGYGERKGQRARTMQLELPLGTVMATGEKHALVMAYLAKHFGDPHRKKGGGVPYGPELRGPLGTVTPRDHHSLQIATLAKFNGNEKNGHPGCADVREPMSTVTAGGGRGGGHIGEVRAFLTAYYGSDGTNGQQLTAPMRTLTAKHRLGLVTIEGTDYQIVDIGFRMLQPHELLRAQFGRFAATYDLSRAKTKKDQVFLIGNSVCPEMAEALVHANVRRREARAA